MVLDEEAQAKVEVWNYTLGTVNTRAVKCAVELEIPDLLEKHPKISLSDLSSAVKCPPSKIYRLMRFLSFNRIFKKTIINDEIHYEQTPLSRLFARDKMAPFMLLHHSAPGAPNGLSAEALRTGIRPHLGIVGNNNNNNNNNNNDTDIGWKADFKRGGNVFTDAMSCHARVIVSAIVDNYPEVFNGVGSLVDVGGRHGTALGVFVKVFPTVRGINFDLPQVVADSPPSDGVVHVGGDMFKSVPKADAAMLMRVLHDWSDEACIEILKKCKEAVPAKTGKVMIIDAVIDEEDNESRDAYAGVRLKLDMMMMAVTVKGKERTYKEWVHLLNSAGFTSHKVTNIQAIEFVIEAFP